MNGLFTRFVYVCLLMVLSMTSCAESRKDGQSPVDPEQGQGVSVEFRFDLGDVLEEQTRARSGLQEGCPSMEELFVFVEQGNLFANFTIRFTSGEEQLYEEVALNYVYVGEGQLFTDPILFDIPAQGEVCPQIYQVAIYRYDEQDDIKLLFSSVLEGATSAGWIDEECLLPQTICLDKEDVYTKKEVSVCVFCTYDEDASYFGYFMWNLSFKRIICFPFAVNICDEFTFEDHVGIGSLAVESGQFKDGVFQRDDMINQQINFPESAYQLADLCFVDDMSQADDHEWFRFLLTIEDRTFEAIVSVRSLLDYQSYASFDQTRRYLHISLCPNEDSWYFYELGVDRCLDSLFLEMPTHNDRLKATFTYYDEVQDRWDFGLPTSQTVEDDTPYAFLPSEVTVVTRRGFSFMQTDSLMTYIRLVVTSVQVDSYVQLSLCHTHTLELAASYRLGPISPVSDAYLIPFDNFVPSLSEGCYSLKLQTEGDIQFKALYLYQEPPP